MARFAAFAQDEVHLVVNFAFMDQVKAAEVKSAHDLGFRKRAVFTVGESEIPALQDWQFREDAAIDKIDEIEHSAQIWCKAFIEKLFTLGDGLAIANKNAPLFQHLIYSDQVGVKAAEIINFV